MLVLFTFFIYSIFNQIFGKSVGLSDVILDFFILHSSYYDYVFVENVEHFYSFLFHFYNALQKASSSSHGFG